MIRHENGRRDGRYTVTRELCGEATPRYVARFCGDWIGKADDAPGAWAQAEVHRAEMLRGMTS